MSKPSKKRIFGMTIAQLAILGCLSLVAIGTIYGGFIFISSSTTPDSSAMPPTPVPPLVFEPTITPDLTELDGFSPTATLVLGEFEIPPDWKQYATSRFEVWLPPQFESVNAVIEREGRITSYREQGYEFLAQKLESGTFDYRFWFNFPQPDTNAYGTNIIVTEDVLPTLTLDEYVDEAYGNGLEGFEVSNRQEFTVQDLEARRIVLDANLSGNAISVAEYVITDGVNLWIISCGASLEEFFTRLPEFDRVARSFRLLY